MYSTISMPEFDRLYQENKNLSILDVQEPGEFLRGHIRHAHSLPLTHLAEQVVSLEKDQTYYVICQSGNRSTVACQYLSISGFQAINIRGGMSAWKGARV